MLLNVFRLTNCGVVLVVCDQFEMSCIVDFTNVDAYYCNIIISLEVVVICLVNADRMLAYMIHVQCMSLHILAYSQHM